MRLPSVKRCATAIDLPTRAWAGNCYYVARALVLADLIPGAVAFGEWHGTVDPSALWALLCVHRYCHGLRRHAWIRLTDGTAVDPTRWVFENRKPYIWHGEEAHEYVEGDDSRLLKDKIVPFVTLQDHEDFWQFIGAAKRAKMPRSTTT